jgi:hypothetical protein
MSGIAILSQMGHLTRVCDRAARGLAISVRDGDISFIADFLNMGISHIIRTGRGRVGKTWAHWQVALPPLWPQR